MSASNSLESLARTLAESLEAAEGSLREPEQFVPPPNGISLLDTKNQLFLSYVQNLVFLILLKLRERRSRLRVASDGGSEPATSTGIQEDVTKRLVELRVYLERGVKPLEGRLRYQIDKVVRAAEDAKRKADANGAKTKGSKSTQAPSNGVGAAHGDGSDASSASDDSEELDPLAYRPNPSAFARPGDSRARGAKIPEASTGVYRPPRIASTTMPDDRPSRAERTNRPVKSATMEEFVASELSTAPVAEPSIGTTIRQGGRRTTNERERREARERQAYEEANFVRLPKESKADRRRKGGRDRDGGWGGEEWRDIGRGAERVTSALSRSSRHGDTGRVVQALARSRKRDPGPTGGGGRSGEAYEKTRQSFEDRAKRRKVR